MNKFGFVSLPERSWSKWKLEGDAGNESVDGDLSMSGSVEAVELSDPVSAMKDDTDIVNASREMEVEVENCPQQENGQKLVNGIASGATGDAPRSLVIRFKAPRDSMESVVSPVSSVHSGSSSESDEGGENEEEEEDDDEEEVADNNVVLVPNSVPKISKERKKAEKEVSVELMPKKAKKLVEKEEEKVASNGVVLMPNSAGKSKSPSVEKKEKTGGKAKAKGRADRKSPKGGDGKRSPRKPGGSSKKSYLGMIQTALLKIKEKNGASLIKIRKFVLSNNDVKSGNARFNQHFSATLKKAVNDKVIIRVGARYKLSDKSKAQLKTSQRMKKRKSLPKNGKKGSVKAKAPPKVELTAEQIKERKKKQERLRKEKEMKEYKASLPKLPTPSYVSDPSVFYYLSIRCRI